MTAPSHVYSYGGGVQSTAMLVLAAQGYLPAGPFLFANVGDDSEHPGTVEYVRNVAFEYAARHGLDVHELERAPGDTIWGRIMAPGSYDVPIPMRGSDTGAPGARSCTANYKIDVVSRWVRDAGATPDQPVHVGIGISTDEIERANAAKRSNDREQAWYPLLTLEHRLAPRGANRDQCAAIIADAGLPVPPKSSCYFCPFHKPTTWNDMARDEPDLFERAALLEDTVNERRAARPCPGSGAWPHEATQGLDRDAMGDPQRRRLPAARHRHLPQRLATAGWRRRLPQLPQPPRRRARRCQPVASRGTTPVAPCTSPGSASRCAASSPTRSCRCWTPATTATGAATCATRSTAEPWVISHPRA